MKSTIGCTASLCALAAMAFTGCAKTANTQRADRPSTSLDHGYAGHEPELRSTPDEPTERSAIGGGPREQITAADATLRIALARCEVDLRCGKVGPSSEDKTMEECVSRGTKDKGLDFSASCRNGISPLGLSNCLRTMSRQRCGNLSDTVARDTACRADQFCTEPSTGAPTMGGAGTPGG